MDLSRFKVAIVYGTAGRHWRPEREIEALLNGLKQRDVKEPAVLRVRDVVRGKADLVERLRPDLYPPRPDGGRPFFG